MKSRNYSESEKFAAVERFLVGGESVATIAADTGIFRSTLYAWIKSAQIEPGMLEFTRKNFRMLEAKVKRLEGIVEILSFLGLPSTFDSIASHSRYSILSRIK